MPIATKAKKATKPAVKKTISVGGKDRYHEPAPQGIDVESFRQVVASRRSVRKFTEKPIPKAVLDDCLDMALLAPCSSGLQPWEFYVVKSADKKARLVKACMSQLAAKTASELIVCVARTDRVVEFSRKMLREWPMPDVPPLVKRYYQLIPYNYAPGPLNSFAMVKKGGLRGGGIARSRATRALHQFRGEAVGCEEYGAGLRESGAGAAGARLRQLHDGRF